MDIYIYSNNKKNKICLRPHKINYLFSVPAQPEKTPDLQIFFSFKNPFKFSVKTFKTTFSVFQK